MRSASKSSMFAFVGPFPFMNENPFYLDGPKHRTPILISEEKAGMSDSLICISSESDASERLKCRPLPLTPSRKDEGQVSVLACPTPTAIRVPDRRECMPALACCKSDSPGDGQFSPRVSCWELPVRLSSGPTRISVASQAAQQNWESNLWS